MNKKMKTIYKAKHRVAIIVGGVAYEFKKGDEIDLPLDQMKRIDPDLVKTEQVPVETKNEHSTGNKDRK